MVSQINPIRKNTYSITAFVKKKKKITSKSEGKIINLPFVIHSNDPPDARGPIKRTITCDSSSTSESDLSSADQSFVFYYSKTAIPSFSVFLLRFPVFCWARGNSMRICIVRCVLFLLCLRVIMCLLMIKVRGEAREEEGWREITIIPRKFITQGKRSQR